MKTTKTTLLGVAALMAATTLAPLSALADDQKNKNNARNLGAAAAAIAGYGLLKGNGTATVLGAAGAAYAAKRYEDARKSQDSKQRAETSVRKYHRNYTTGDRHYYRYQGHEYYEQGGVRHMVK